jgi:hypothetical protein
MMIESQLLLKNSHNCEELMRQCCLKFKSELQVVQIELKTATAIIIFQKKSWTLSMT